jgi:PTH1 family peptidyl-tRNA hydrolase
VPPPTAPSVLFALGNPGPRYASTRHNFGWLALDRLADRWRLGMRPAATGPWEEAEGEVAGFTVVLVKPMTFMNRAGLAARGVLERRGLEARTLLALTDDLDLPFGALRLRKRGGAAGHRGMQSLIDCLGTQQFSRLRLGIGGIPSALDPADFVLEPFSEAEWEVARGVIERAADCLEVAVARGLDAAMNEFNRDSAPEADG